MVILQSCYVAQTGPSCAYLLPHCGGVQGPFHIYQQVCSAYLPSYMCYACSLQRASSARLCVCAHCTPVLMQQAQPMHIAGMVAYMNLFICMLIVCVACTAASGRRLVSLASPASCRPPAGTPLSHCSRGPVGMQQIASSSTPASNSRHTCACVPQRASGVVEMQVLQVEFVCAVCGRMGSRGTCQLLYSA